ncbi:hypothetical protein [Salinibacter altiplanensis]|uniref:hypothetical protein n=1 Tax=Salinibacter altiplanensis TaxID=1803181 RepID=UPI000C9F3E83|nr:hypothetical protein [Salinibacter altiplanensis]
MRTVVVLLVAALIPPVANGQVLDTLETASDSTDYEVETYFVRVDTASFFTPHDDEEAVRTLIDRTGQGHCRVITLVRAVNQRRAETLAKRYDGEVINTRLIVRCAPFSTLQFSMPTLTLHRPRDRRKRFSHPYNETD